MIKGDQRVFKFYTVKNIVPLIGSKGEEREQSVFYSRVVVKRQILSKHGRYIRPSGISSIASA